LISSIDSREAGQLDADAAFVRLRSASTGPDAGAAAQRPARFPATPKPAYLTDVLLRTPIHSLCHGKSATADTTEDLPDGS